jgi:hypothetical protein
MVVAIEKKLLSCADPGIAIPIECHLYESTVGIGFHGHVVRYRKAQAGSALSSTRAVSPEGHRRPRVGHAICCVWVRSIKGLDNLDQRSEERLFRILSWRWF